ncbi:MAG: glycosyltransferase [Enterocloster bolteae]
MKVNIVFPVYNEEIRIKHGIEALLQYLEIHKEIRYIITIVDNGSTDNTENIAREYADNNNSIYYIKIEEKGVGIAFKTAVKVNCCDIIGYMDIDLSTDINALSDVWSIFNTEKSVDIVNSTRYSKKSELIGRTKIRNFISFCCVKLLKSQLGMKSSDAICGFKFFKKNIAEMLVDESSDEPGWFGIIEMIIRAERKGIVIKELPVRWVYEKHTKVKILKVTLNYLKQIIRLKKIFAKEEYNE